MIESCISYIICAIQVKIVWFDHAGHAQLLQSCNRECSDIFYLSMVWIDYTEGNAQIKQSCENCFPNHGRDLPSLEILYQQRLLGRATLISQDTSHPAHDLFEPLPSSRRFRSIKTRTNRFSTSFFPLAVQALSKQK